MKHIEIDFNTRELENNIEKVRRMASEPCVFDFDFDLRKLNLIDTVRITLLLSGEIYLKNPKSTINCKIEDKEALNILKYRKLKNTFLSDTLVSKGRANPFKRSYDIRHRKYAK